MTASRAPRTLVRALVPVALLAVGLAACGGDDESSDTTAAAVTEAPAGSEAPASAPTISDAWARSTAPGAANGAAYFVVTGGAQDDAIVGVAVPADIAAMAETHETVMVSDTSMPMGGDTMPMGGDTTMPMGGDATMPMGGDATVPMGGDTTMPMGGGGMTMQHVDRIEVPAGGTVELKPGGYHIMLMDLVAPLVAGDTFELTVTFEKAGDVPVAVTVRDDA